MCVTKRVAGATRQKNCGPGRRENAETFAPLRHGRNDRRGDWQYRDKSQEKPLADFDSRLACDPPIRFKKRAARGAHDGRPVVVASDESAGPAIPLHPTVIRPGAADREMQNRIGTTICLTSCELMQ